MDNRKWRAMKYSWLWVVVGGGNKRLSVQGRLWLVVDCLGWSHDLVMPNIDKSKNSVSYINSLLITQAKSQQQTEITFSH